MIQPAKIIRSSRRSVALVVTPDAQLVVRAPNRASMAHIDDLIARNSEWIRKKLSHAQRMNETYKKKTFADGEKFLFLGQWLTLSVQALVSGVHADGSLLMFPETGTANARELIEAWYKEQCRNIIAERVEVFRRRYGYRVKSVSVSGASRRWGSCGRANSLNFSWRLMGAPMDVIDYVVVHELCHTVEKNHSKRFWQQVRNVLPDYRQSRLWLKQNQRMTDM